MNKKVVADRDLAGDLIGGCGGDRRNEKWRWYASGHASVGKHVFARDHNKRCDVHRADHHGGTSQLRARTGRGGNLYLDRRGKRRRNL